MQTKLTEAEINLIKAGKAELEFAEAVTGVDWRILVGIWYRENSLRKTIPGIIGGVWQFDPPLAQAKVKKLLDKYSTLNDSDKQIAIKDEGKSFKWGSVVAACFLRDKVKWVLDVRKRGDLPDNEVGDSLYSYNGRAYGAWEKSPYVNNNADSNHMGLKMNATLPGPNGTRVKVLKTDQRLGAFVVYRELKQLFPRQNKTASLKEEIKTIKESLPLQEAIKKEQQNNKSEEKQKTVSFIDGSLNEPKEK